MTATPQPIDHDALRAKYRLERDKRLRADGNAQYIEPSGRFGNLLDDPYTPRVEREPLADEVTFAFIGAGFAGLVAGARLKQAGIDDVRLIDGAGDGDFEAPADVEATAAAVVAVMDGLQIQWLYEPESVDMADVTCRVLNALVRPAVPLVSRTPASPPPPA